MPVKLHGNGCRNAHDRKLDAGGGREKPWHQDKAYFRVPVDAPVIACWLALDDVTAENGSSRTPVRACLTFLEFYSLSHATEHIRTI